MRSSFIIMCVTDTRMGRYLKKGLYLSRIIKLHVPNPQQPGLNGKMVREATDRNSTIFQQEFLSK